MKLLLKLLGVSNYIEQLESLKNEDIETITNLLSERTRLTAEVLKLREQLKEADIKLSAVSKSNKELDLMVQELQEANRKLDKTNSDYLCTNKRLLLKLEKFRNILSDISTGLINTIDNFYD